MSKTEFLIDLIEKSNPYNQVLHLYGKHNSELVIVANEEDNLFYLTLLDGTKTDQKVLLRKAVKLLSQLPSMEKKKLSMDDLYDINSLMSASSIYELYSKMIFILKGI